MRFKSVFLRSLRNHSSRYIVLLIQKTKPLFLLMRRLIVSVVEVTNILLVIRGGF